MAQVAFLGLDTMGPGMVRNLLQAGHAVTVHNRTPERMSPAVELRSGRPRRGGCRGGRRLRHVLPGRRPSHRGGRPPQGRAHRHGQPRHDGHRLVHDFGRYGPAGARRLPSPGRSFHRRSGLRLPKRGRRWWPLGRRRWRQGGLRAGARSPRADLRDAPLHGRGGQRQPHEARRQPSRGRTAQLQSLGDALTLAHRTGLNLADVLGVLDVTDFHTPIYSGVGRRILEGDYAPDFALKLLVKDLHLIEDLADSAAVELPTLALTTEVAEAGVGQGWGEENASAVIKLLAQRAGVDLAQ